jgi:uncharacterized protein YndB with AHSA1/START domain
MAANLIAKVEVTIEAPATKVWEALTSPELIKQYLFGAEAISDWKEGSELRFVGEWEGKPYEEKGRILQCVPNKLLQFTSFSSFSDLEDSEENYRNVSYQLDEDNGVTTLVLKQENNESEKAREHSENNWRFVLEKLKELVESQAAMAH